MEASSVPTPSSTNVARCSDPWGDQSSDNLPDNVLAEDTWATDDFSKLTVHECNHKSDLKHQTIEKEREIDQEYLRRLEQRLEKLYKTSGRADKLSMIKQLQHRSDYLMSQDRGTQSVTSSPADGGDRVLTPGYLTRRVIPEQALSTEEKLHLVKHDLLQHETDHSETEALEPIAGAGTGDSTQSAQNLSDYDKEVLSNGQTVSADEHT